MHLRLSVTYGPKLVGRDSSVGIATRHVLDGPGIQLRLGGVEDFLHPSRLALELTHPPVQWVPGSFPLRKRAEAWR